MDTFLKAMKSDHLDRASACLDLSGIPAATVEIKGQTYAEKLYQVLLRFWEKPPTWKITDDPNHDPPYQLSDILTEYMEPEKWSDARYIQMVPDDGGRWRFSKTTLQAVEEELFDRWADRSDAKTIPVWIENLFQGRFSKKHFLLKDYQWVCLIILTLFGFIIGRLSRYLLDGLTKLWFRIMRAKVDDQPRLKLWGPVSLMINALTWYFGAKMIDLPAEFLGYLLIALKFFAVVIAVWTAFRAINVLVSVLQRKAALTPSRYDDSLVPLVGNILKIVSVLLGVVLFVDVFELDWKAVLGGFGLGGIAIAIASKDVLANFFGSVTVLTDRPFEIGDWVVIDGKVEGTVEAVGMRSSRIRTFYSSEVIVPNTLLTTAIVDNLGRRKLRRFKTDLCITYDTPTQKIEAFCAGIRQLIKNSPYAKSAQSYVYLHNFNDSSIDIMIYMFFACSDWETELRERHCFLRDTLKLAEELGVEFAFPTRTLHVAHETNGSPNLPGSLIEMAESGREVADKIQQPKRS